MKLYSITLFILASLLFGKTEMSPYEIGDYVADFKLKNVDGKMVSLADKKDVKGYILVFSCNTCPVVKAYEQRIIRLNEMYAEII